VAKQTYKRVLQHQAVGSQSLTSKHGYAFKPNTNGHQPFANKFRSTLSSSSKLNKAIPIQVYYTARHLAAPLQIAPSLGYRTVAWNDGVIKGDVPLFSTGASSRIAQCPIQLTAAS
jgi:hypothetical protein